MRQLFTDEEIDTLSQNIYTRSVSKYVIKFTDDFKEDFWRLYATDMPINEIFQTLGYNPELLGEKRTEGFIYNLRKAKLTFEQRAESIKVHGTSAPLPTFNFSEIRSQEAINAMAAELKYLRQEVAFLKKLFLAISRNLEESQK